MVTTMNDAQAQERWRQIATSGGNHGMYVFVGFTVDYIWTLLTGKT